MLIDDFISAEKNNPQNGGSNKKCFLFEEYALLYGSFKEKEQKKLIQITQNLEQQGVALLPTLEYKIDIPPNSLGYARGYSLQQRATGTELYRSRMTEDEYKIRLSEIAEMSSQKMDKFVSDWLTISNAGLMVDPSKCENFFWNKEKISFIDLGFREPPISLKSCFKEASNVLMGLGLKSKYKTDGKDLTKIIKKTTQAFLKQGLDPNEARDVLTGYSYFIDKKQLDSVINELLPPAPQNGFLSHAFSRPAKTLARQERAEGLLRLLKDRDQTNKTLSVMAFKKKRDNTK